MVEAHRFFSEQAREWLNAEGDGRGQHRAAAVENGGPRSPADGRHRSGSGRERAGDLRNAQRSRRAAHGGRSDQELRLPAAAWNPGPTSSRSTSDHWKEFETAFWETEVAVGRLRYPRISVFLNHWLIAQTGEEIVAREVFDRFKRYADHDAGVPMPELLRRIHRASGVYRKFVTDAHDADRRRSTDSGCSAIARACSRARSSSRWCCACSILSCRRCPTRSFPKALDVVESWMVRRMLVRATTKSYNQAVAELVKLVRSSTREQSRRCHRAVPRRSDRRQPLLAGRCRTARGSE